MNKRIKYLPNLLTITRIFLTPICIYLLLSNNPLVAFMIFIIASLTDALDGYYARKYDLISRLGTFLDPLADKIMIVSVFVYFFYHYNNIVDIYILAMIIFRDVFVTVIRIVMEYKKCTMVTSNLSKMKTAFQMIMIALMFVAMISKNISTYSYYLHLAMVITGLLTFYTGLHYFVYNYNKLKLLVISNESN